MIGRTMSRRIHSALVTPLVCRLRKMSSMTENSTIRVDDREQHHQVGEEYISDEDEPDDVPERHVFPFRAPSLICSGSGAAPRQGGAPRLARVKATSQTIGGLFVESQEMLV